MATIVVAEAAAGNSLKARGPPAFTRLCALIAEPGRPQGTPRSLAVWCRVQAYRVGDERAETYLRLLAETQLRLVLRPSLRPTDIASSVRRQVRAGRILVAAGLLDDEVVDGLAADIETALTVRSRVLLERPGAATRTFRNRYRTAPWPGGAAEPQRVTPVGQTVRVRSDRARCDLHLLTLVRARSETAIIAAIRMHWPPDGSTADLEMTGAGVQHLPYDQLWATDDRGARYSLDFDGDGGTATWHGVIRLLPPPPPGARWLDLIADGTSQLLRLDLDPGTPEPSASAGATIEESAGLSAAEWLLAAAAEGTLLETWDRPGPVIEPYLAEITSVLTDAGAIAADSPTPGQLAALCRELGVVGHGIAAAPAASIPGPWASIVAQRNARAAGPPPLLAAPVPDVFTPLGTRLPDIDGTGLTLAGLSSAAGESHLHVAVSGLPEPGVRYERGWRPGLSWWLKDPAGHWHMATAVNYLSSTDTGVLWLRLTPPLATYPDTIEVVVTGTSGRLRAVVPVPARQNASIPDRQTGRKGGH